MIYNNENKEYKIKIWASKWEKVEIKNEYNQIIRKLCEKKSGNNVLKNLLQLKPEKYTIYYFPISISLFEKELVFIYILIMTRKEKSKFKNFKQIKDLISYSKSFLIPKINDLLYEYNKNSKIYDTNAFAKTINNDNKENNIFNNNRRFFNYISPKNKEIHINYNGDQLKKILTKKNESKNVVNPANFLKKPYNKIVFNYSFEKNDNNIHNNNSNTKLNISNTAIHKMKSYRNNSNEKRNRINTIIINTNDIFKSNNYIRFPINKINRLNDENTNINNSLQNLPFSVSHMNNSTTIIPYSKKRPSSIPRRIFHYLSTNNYCLQYKKNNCDKENELIKSNSTINYNQLSYKNKSKRILYKRKSFSKKKSQQSIELNSNCSLNKLNGLNIPDTNSTLDVIEPYIISNSNNKTNSNNNINKNSSSNILDKENSNCIILNKIQRNKNHIYNGSMTSINPLIKTYNFKKGNNIINSNEDNNNSNSKKIPVVKKSSLKIKFRNSKLKDDIKLNSNNGNKTSRNIINKKIRKELLFKQNTCDKIRLNRMGDNQNQKNNDSDEEISLFL
jgi:hypothetical protein